MADADREQFFAALDESLAGGRLVKLTLSKYRGREAGLKNVYVRPVTLKGGGRLSFLYRHRTRDAVSNHTLEGGARLVRELLAEGFASCHLFTTTQDLRLDISRKGDARLSKTPPAFSSPPAEEHD